MNNSNKKTKKIIAFLISCDIIGTASYEFIYFHRLFRVPSLMDSKNIL